MDNQRGPASFWTQADALFRKNLAFQKRRKKANCQLLLCPIILCGLLFLAKKWSSGSSEQDKPFPPGYACSDVELNNNFTKCWIPRPHEYPPLLQIPESDNRAVRIAFLPFGDLPDGSCKKTNSCPVTVLVTGSNKSLGLDLAGRFFPRSSILNSSDILNSFADGVFGSTSEPETAGGKQYLDPAFYSKDPISPVDPIYTIQRRCRRNSSSFIYMGSDRTKIVVKCIKGLRLWRNSSSEIDDELFKGFPTGNSENMTNEIIAAYDFLNSNDKNFNISVWYNSSMNEGNQGKENAVMRVALSVNLSLLCILNWTKWKNYENNIK